MEEASAGSVDSARMFPHGIDSLPLESGDSLHHIGSTNRGHICLCVKCQFIAQETMRKELGIETRGNDLHLM